jgi:hypothetical protein
VIPDSAREVLTSGRLGHLATIDPDGSPQITCAWIGRVSLSVETSNMNPHGLIEYLVVYGRARVTEGGAPELLQRLAYTYIGPGVTFAPMANPPPGFVTRIAPIRYGGIGPGPNASAS